MSDVRAPCVAVRRRGLDLTELSIHDVREVFPESFLERLAGFDFCGAYGDPAVARDLIEIVQYIRNASPKCHITAYTNGGIRTPVWWEQLAQALRRDASFLP